MTQEVIARVETVTKTYQMGAVLVEALRGVTIDFYEGDYMTIMGPSGCGKSTLMNLLGCLDQPTTGTYLLGGHDVSMMDDNELSSIRGARLGFIFQSYNLIQQLNVVENIELPLYYQGRHEDESRAVSVELANRVGLGDRMYHKPFELSGGQQQRVAIARALANDPLIILADEPTGNLDEQTSLQIFDLLAGITEEGRTVILVTHEASLADRTQRTIRLRDGRVVDEAA